MTLHGFTHLSALAGGALIAAAWQGLVLAGLAALALHLLPRISAAARWTVWSAVMALAVALPFAHLQAAPVAGPVASGPIYIEAGWSVALVAVWALFSLFRLAQLGRSALYLRGIARSASPVEVEPALKPLLSIGKRHIELCVSRQVARPSVVGFFWPRILIPAALMERLTQAELQQIVLHEMEHLRRGDDWTNLLQKLALAVFPLNPALLVIERQLCLERELACDDRVLRATRAPKAYAACLANLAEHALVRRGVSLALGAWERQSELVRRVHRILAGGAGEMSPRRAAVAMTILLAGVAASGDVLAHSPQLVGFAESAPVVTATTSSARSIAPHVQNVGTSPSAMLVKAIMPSARVPMLHRIAATVARPAMVEQLQQAKLPRARMIEARQLVAPRLASDAATTVDADQPVMVLVTWRTTTTAAGTTTLKTSYAAVPTANGWLFVQL